MIKSEIFEGILFGWFETGCEGTLFALQEQKHITDDGKSWSYDGLHVIDPGDHLAVYKDDKEILDITLEGITSFEAKDKDPLIDEDDFFAGYKKYPLNPQYGQLLFVNNWVHWLPTNVDLRLWYSIFFSDTEKYTGRLKKIIRSHNDSDPSFQKPNL